MVDINDLQTEAHHESIYLLLARTNLWHNHINLWHHHINMKEFQTSHVIWLIAA